GRRQFVRTAARQCLSLAILVLLIGCVVPAAPVSKPAHVFRIGFLATAPGPQYEAFHQGLREHGWIEGKNSTVQYRFADGVEGRLAALASERVDLNLDVIVAASSAETHAVKNATSTIPIVMGPSGNPVRDGLVASLARPGGNVTGVTANFPELS